MGGILLANGDLDQALRHCNTALEIDKQFAPAYGVCAFVAYRRGDYERCLVNLNRCLEISPLPSCFVPEGPYELRGKARLRLGRPREALNNFLMARKLNLASRTACQGICDAYADLGKWHMAANASENIRKLSGDRYKDNMRCAYMYAKACNKAEAIKYIEEALRNKPAVIDADTAAYRATVHFAVGDFSGAESYFDIARNTAGGLLAGVAWESDAAGGMP